MTEDEWRTRVLSSASRSDENISFYIWLFLIFFFSLFEIFALLFFSSQILSLSLAFTVFDIKNLKWIPRSKRGRVTFHFDVLFFGREISVLGNWVPSLMKPGTRLCIGKKNKNKRKKRNDFLFILWRGLRAVFTELLTLQIALNFPGFSILNCQSSLLPLWIAVHKKRFVPVRADCLLSWDRTKWKCPCRRTDFKTCVFFLVI